MSSDLLPDQTVIVKMPRQNGTIQHGFIPRVLIHMYLAGQFDHNYKIRGDNFHPRPPRGKVERATWDTKHFRLKVNGRWLCPVKQFTFYTREEIAGLIMGYGDHDAES